MRVGERVQATGKTRLLLDHGTDAAEDVVQRVERQTGAIPLKGC